jgi:phytoene synthase
MSLSTKGTGMEGAFRTCQAYTREHAKSFYFASHVLPREKRMASYAVYAFCREADNIVDVGATPESAARLEELRQQLARVYGAPGALRPHLAALRETVAAYAIPREYFLDLIRGVEMDLTRSRYDRFEDLKEYCYCVASVVGLMMAKIFGVSDGSAYRHAADLGTAMQLTNILRDIREDHAMGRIYLPQEDLAGRGYAEADLARGVVDDRFRDLMRFQIARAREYYAAAEPGIPMLTNDGSRFCARLMSTTYAGILTAIERNGYDVFARRAYVPAAGKLRIALGAALAVRPGAEGSPRASVDHQMR